MILVFRIKIEFDNKFFAALFFQIPHYNNYLWNEKKKFSDVDSQVHKKQNIEQCVATWLACNF